ncbi:MAG TPA: 7TM-DISM domain-containing protein [Chitinophagales bacterium]|nr:7TM-DISM domain-containing protein [Chitinophagales bacterium]
MKKIKYILFSCCIFLQLISAASEIKITDNFSSVDLYNALQNDENISDKNVSLSLELNNVTTSKQELYLSIINPTIDKIIILDDSTTVVLGDLTPFHKRKFKHYNHIYPIVLAANQHKRIQITVQKQWQAINFRVNLASQNTFIKTTNHDNFFMGIFFGIFFMYFLLLICFYIFSKSPFFTIYLLINLFMLLLIFQYSGTGFQYIWFYSTGVQNYVTMIAVLGYLITHISFVRAFFALQFKNNLSGMALRFMMYIFIVFSILFLFQLFNRSFGYGHTYLFYILFNALFLLYGLMVMALCMYSYKVSRQREVIWVFIGMIFHLLNWMLFINNEFGILKPLNFLDNLKLFTSNIFVPQLNYFITMLEIFVITIFISISYHKLIRQNNISTQRLDFLQKRNINTFVVGQEAEREKISKEIESSISNDIKQLKEKLLTFHPRQDEKKIIPTVLNEIDKTLEDIRNITNNYVAPDMQQMSLISIITTATDKLYSELHVQYDFTKINEQLSLNAVTNINLYRILQEISNNIIKHAEARQVTITAVKDSKSLQIKITDDGIGFGESITNSKGIGLMNIESRMNSLNGHFYLLSNERSGSVMHLIFSLNDVI